MNYVQALAILRHPAGHSPAELEKAREAYKHGSTTHAMLMRSVWHHHHRARLSGLDWIIIVVCGLALLALYY